MAKRFLTTLNLPNLASNPETGAEGDLYFNTTDKLIKIYVNNQWTDLQSSGSAVSSGGGSVVGGTNINVNYNEESNTYTVNTNSDLENIDSISTPKFIEFDTTFIPDNGMPKGSLYWHEEHQTLHLSLDNEVELDIGQQEHYPAVINNSGVQINKGELVMVTGVQGDKLTIAKAVSDGTVDFDYIIGIAAHNIPNTSDTATIIKFGYINAVNTNSYDVGTILYPDRLVPGGLTNILPDAPGYKVPIAIVTKKGTGGRILVRMSIPSRLGESDSNVEFAELQNDDILIYNSASSLWVNSPIQDYINTASAAAFASASAYVDLEIGSLTTTDIEEGSNLYFTNQRALDATVSTIESASAAAVSSANDYTDSEVASAIVTASAAAVLYADSLTTTDIDEGNNLYFTEERSLNTASTALVHNDHTNISAIFEDDKIKLTASGSNETQINSQSASYTLVLEDNNKIVEINSSSVNNVTIPLNSSVSFPVGTNIDVVQIGEGQTSFVAESGVTILSKESLLSLSGQYSAATIYKRSTDEWVLIGDLA